MMTPSAANAAGVGAAAKVRVSQPSCRYSSLFDAVSQISIERKCERLGCGIADALQHRQLALLPERQQRRERGVQADRVGELHHLVARDRELRPQRVIRARRSKARAC